MEAEADAEAPEDDAQPKPAKVAVAQRPWPTGVTEQSRRWPKCWRQQDAASTSTPWPSISAGVAAGATNAHAAGHPRGAGPRACGRWPLGGCRALARSFESMAHACERIRVSITRIAGTAIPSSTKKKTKRKTVHRKARSQEANKKCATGSQSPVQRECCRGVAFRAGARSRLTRGDRRALPAGQGGSCWL